MVNLELISSEKVLLLEMETCCKGPAYLSIINSILHVKFNTANV